MTNGIRISCNIFFINEVIRAVKNVVEAAHWNGRGEDISKSLRQEYIFATKTE